MPRTILRNDVSLWVRLKILCVDSVLFVSGSGCCELWEEKEKNAEKREKCANSHQTHNTRLPSPLESLNLI